MSELSELSDLERRLAERIPDEEPGEAEALAREQEEIRARARVYLGLRPDASLEEIRAAFGSSLWDYWIFFFAHFRQDENGRPVAGADFQEELAAAVERLILGRGGKQLARAYPREHAKSVFASLVAPMWAALHGHRRFGFIFSDTDTQAWGFLEDIKDEIETSELLQAIYPEQCEWKAQPRVSRLVFGNGAILAAAGSGKSVRGARKGKQRPDFIVLDDIENDEEVENPRRRKKKVRWYHKVVKKLGKAAVFIIVGTILHAESFLAQQVRSEADIFAAVVQDAENQKLWEQWEEILLDRSRLDPESDARAYYEARRAEMDRGAVVLWPARYTLYELYVERAEDLASYLSERQNKPFDPSASWFPEDRMVFLEADDLPSDDDVLLSVAFWDPSRGTSKSDTSSTCRLDVLRDGRRIVREAVADRIPPEEVMDVLIGWERRRHFDVVGVEKVGLSSYDETMRTRADHAGAHLRIEPVTPKGDKHLRIRSLRPDIVAQTLQFGPGLPLEAVRQIKFYPQHPNDDFPDTVQQAMALADEYTRDVPAAGGTVEPGPPSREELAEAALGRPRLFDDGGPERPGLAARDGILGRVWS